MRRNFWNAPALGAVAVGLVCSRGLAQLVVTNSAASFMLTSPPTAVGAYDSIVGGAAFLSLVVDGTNPLSINASAYAVARFAAPQAVPPLPFTEAVISRSGVSVARAKVAQGEPEWASDNAGGQGGFYLLFPFSFGLYQPYSEALLKPGDYTLSLVGGTNSYPVHQFSMVQSSYIPVLKAQPVQGSLRLSWESSSSGLISLQEATSLDTWQSIGVYNRSKGDVAVPLGSGNRFFRLSSNF